MHRREMIPAVSYAAATVVALVAALLCAWETGAPISAALLMVAPALIVTAAALRRATKTTRSDMNDEDSAAAAGVAPDLGDAGGVGRAGR